MHDIEKSTCDSQFDKVYDDTFSECRRFVALRCADPNDISDLLQEIYLEYYSLLRRKGLSYIENDRALIFTIAARKVKRYYSFKQKLRRLMPFSHYTTDEDSSIILDIPDQCCMEEKILEASETECIQRYLSRYPVETRKIVYLYYAEEMKLQDIAFHLNLLLSTVKSRLYRTLNQLKKKVEG